MVSSLNLVKSVSRYEKTIAMKCGWPNADKLPLRKNILPDGFIGKAKPEPNIITIGTKLNPNNFTVMEIIMSNDKISKSPFVRSNMTQILKMANSEEGSKIIQKILTPETIDKLDGIRAMVKRYPSKYIKDKSSIKYINSPAGLNTLFNDISMLKAASVLDKKELDTLFKMDITCGEGKRILDNIGKMDLGQINIAQISLKEGHSIKI